ncbi:MAG: hypothetical protein ACJAVK_001934 [Akkermansiaceae bacterium]|jgi:hypothetical protein
MTRPLPRVPHHLRLFIPCLPKTRIFPFVIIRPSFDRMALPFGKRPSLKTPGMATLTTVRRSCSLPTSVPIQNTTSGAFQSARLKSFTISPTIPDSSSTPRQNSPNLPKNTPLCWPPNLKPHAIQGKEALRSTSWSQSTAARGHAVPWLTIPCSLQQLRGSFWADQA